MITSFHIKNFRCFRDFTLDNLERVNLIAGRNNTGKTSLLEALFLHAGPNSPDLPLRLNSLRGIEQFYGDAEDAWGWLFCGKRVDDSIELQTINRNGKSCTLRIRLVDTGVSELVPPGNGDQSSPKVVESLTTASRRRDLLLEYQGETGQPVTSRASLSREGVILQRGGVVSVPLTMFCITLARLGLEDVQRFSKLEEIGRQDELLHALKILDSRLQRVSLLFMGGTPMLHGDIGIGKLVPLPLMGEGIVRLTAVLLAIASSHGGTILIDEIENGLHYSVMTKVWQAIAVAARQADVQVFATTHSWECIRAAHEAFSASEQYDFRLHRLDRIGDDIRSVTYKQNILDTALETGLEVR